jgi:hypothetical protein
MSDPLKTPWKRILIEGVAIVASILVAFAIDAWWENRQETDSEIRSLARVSAELEANSERIQNKLQTIESSIEATSTFISWMGPQPASVGRAVLVEQWDNLYGIGFFALQRSATREYLATGHMDMSDTAEVRQAISDWHSSSTALEDQYERLRVAHANISNYLQDAMPILHMSSGNDVMSDHPISRFPFDQAAFLADPRLESRLAMFLIRMEFVSEQAADLKDVQRELVASIEKAIHETD